VSRRWSAQVFRRQWVLRVSGRSLTLLPYPINMSGWDVPALTAADFSECSVNAWRRFGIGREFNSVVRHRGRKERRDLKG